MKVQYRKFLRKITIILIFVANITQSIWWIYLSISLIKPLNYQLCILQAICLIARICQYILIRKSLGLIYLVHVVSLLYYTLYIESFLLLQYHQTLFIITNCLIMTLSYIEYEKIAVQKYSLICKLGLPIYFMIRIILFIKSQFNHQMIESLVIIFIVFVHQLLTQYLNFNKNLYLKNSKQEQQKERNNDKETPAIAQNNIMQSLLRSQSRITLLQSSKKRFTIQLKELPEGQKLKRYSNFTSFSKSQKNVKCSGSSQYSMLQLYQNLINLFPYGILILNQSQQISYINNKCEKILECQGAEQVLENVKICVNSAKMQENASETSNKQSKKLNHYHLLQQVVRKLQINNLSVDILDIILQPLKYSGILGQDEIELFKNFQQSIHQQVFIYEWLIKSDQITSNFQKKLKLILIPTSMTNQQQEYISASSQIKSSSKIHSSNHKSDSENPVLLIIIKNITNKYQCQQMRDEQIIHHSLIKSFSHELRTPLNSCYQMLNLMKQQQNSNTLQEQIDIAQCSITLLIHQINDILDYAAIQSFCFTYNITNFPIRQIIEEIENLYVLQTSLKNIHFKIQISDNLKERILCNDKQRIIQLLVNLLNNSIKFTPQGGSICLNIIEADKFYINFQIKDNGIGIDKNKLTQIQNNLHNTIEFGAVLKSHSGIKQPGLGLIIAAKLIEGLIESKDNKLIINSNRNSGTLVQFQVEDWQQKNQFSSHLPIKQQSEKLNQLVNQSEYIENNTIMHEQIQNSKNQNDSNLQSIKSESLYTPKLNDSGKQPQISLPISPDYFSKKTINYYNDLQNVFQSDSSNKLNSSCSQCINILIVDDIPFNQIALKMILKKYQIEVDSAFDGFQAIEKVKQKMSQHCPNYKLILMDIEMPGMDGFQASKQIIELTSNQAFIVICSAYDTQENIQQGKNLGINTFLTKPVKQDELSVLLSTVFLIDYNSNTLQQEQNLNKE
ncbi:unnamed protein product [Paramecium sonneborni]|uniref:Uncharacterized protein n=1 Tax=Paramecium sonneborni TaxID=65129 RepID=A0A8S1RDL5_9CILI|nr:unnamed protein product [Paramecium sonneborni]